jgi:cell division protein FtsB
VAAQQADNQRLSERNRKLAAEVHDLKQGYSALEERARSDLGMVADNETYYQVVPASPAGSPPAPAPPAPPAMPAAEPALVPAPTRTAAR